jgi:hypothetical protein
MKPSELAIEYEAFRKHLEGLNDDDLLDAKIEFDGLPKAAAGSEYELRLLRSICFEAALLRKFGYGTWRKSLEERRKVKPEAKGLLF